LDFDDESKAINILLTVGDGGAHGAKEEQWRSGFLEEARCGCEMKGQ
jgi:hypothetical protein